MSSDPTPPQPPPPSFLCYFEVHLTDSWDYQDTFREMPWQIDVLLQQLNVTCVFHCTDNGK